MAFFKKYNGTQDKRLLRLERMSWFCIYGGLLALVLGYFLAHTQGGDASALYVGGALALALGVLQIYIRSRLHESN